MNKKERRLAAKAAGVSTETKNAIKDAVNVSSQEKAKTADEPIKKKKKATVEPTTEKEKSLDKKTAIAVVKSITEVKDLKYIYPADVDSLDKRKKFRAEVRRKIAAQEKEIAKLAASDLPEDQKLLESKSKAYDKYAKTVYVNPKKALALS